MRLAQTVFHCAGSHAVPTCCGLASFGRLAPPLQPEAFSYTPIGDVNIVLPAFFMAASDFAMTACRQPHMERTPRRCRPAVQGNVPALH
jgi:hypothetical protein